MDASRPSVAMLVLPAINDMMDISAKRAIALRTHLPGVIVGLLTVSAILSGLLVGYAMAKRRDRSSVHIAVYGIMLALTIYVVLDIDHPRFGVIRIDVAYQPLNELRQSIK